MKPKPFRPESTDNPKYVKDQTTDNIWHQCKSRILYADTDQSQFVYHANYLRFFELGRASLMRDTAYSYHEIEKSGYVYPIIEVGIRYHSALHYDDPMLIHSRPGELERVRLRFDYVITHEETGKIVCIGFTKHCAINASGKPVGIDEKTRHLWKSFPK